MSSSVRFGSILFLAIVVSSCSQQEVVQNEEGAFVLGSVEQTATSERGISPGSRSIEISGINGTFDLTGVAGEVANFSITKRARGTSTSNALKLLDKISIEETGDDLTYSFDVDSPERALSAVDISATIPSNTPVVLHFASGSVTISKMNGRVEVRGTAGSISYSGSSQAVTLETRNGDISTSFDTVGDAANISLQTSNGDIEVAFPPSSSVDITATTSAGKVSTSGIDLNNRSLASNGVSAKFSARSGNGLGKLSAKTFHGNVSFGKWDPAVPAPMDTTSTPAPAVDDELDIIEPQVADSAGIDALNELDVPANDSIPRP